MEVPGRVTELTRTPKKSDILRALTQSLAKAYAEDRIHVVHVRIDCDLDVPAMRELYGDRYDPEALASPDDVAGTQAAKRRLEQRGRTTPPYGDLDLLTPNQAGGGPSGN